DLQAWLKAMEFKWSEVFSHKLGHTGREADRDTNVSRARSFVNELRYTRNLFSHESPKDEFTDEDVHRIADTATCLMKAVKARQQASSTAEIKLEVGEKLYVPEESPVEDVEPEPLPAQNAKPVVPTVQEPPPHVDLRGAKLRKMDL
ncbi:MAG: hypothetical protein J4G18_15640, partial [Anaerolineae bacterium]|nr:hypothetical protein [Anaerolineae bacterium]